MPEYNPKYHGELRTRKQLEEYKSRDPYSYDEAEYNRRMTYIRSEEQRLLKKIRNSEVDENSNRLVRQKVSEELTTYFHNPELLFQRIEVHRTEDGNSTKISVNILIIKNSPSTLPEVILPENF